MELRKSVVKGMAWTAAEKVGTLLFQMAVGLIVANLLVPEDYAAVTILVAFVAICNVFVDSGFSAALIRRKEAGGKEFTSVFFFNILVAVALYLILLCITPWLASFYEMPVLRQIAPVIFLIIPANSLGIIQSTILTRELDFRALSRYTLTANLIASVVAVLLALAGLGFWALVGQRLVTPVIRTALLWMRSKWRPSGGPAFGRLRPMLGYSMRLMATDFVNSVYGNISQLFIGKLYTKAELGYFDQARKIKDMPVSSAISTIQGVTFPALSRLQDDEPKLRLTSHQVIMVMNFILFPAMVGLIAVAPDMFSVLLKADWQPTVPLFQILCISGIFAPLSVVTYNIMKIKSDGRLIMRAEIVKKIVATAVLAITIPAGVRAIVWGQTFIFLSDAVVNFFGARKYVKWGAREVFSENVPYILMSLAMWAAVFGVQVLLRGAVAQYWLLLLEILAGVAVYMLLAWIFKPVAWKEARTILRQMSAKGS